ncbi:hypothetical protein [Methylobacterium sp. CM6244]
MKKLKFTKLYLLSRKERKARKEVIDPNITVIFGENDTGKSHFVKSMYTAFGAEPQVINEKWVQASVTIMMDFLINEKSYSILKFNNQYGLFDGDGKLLWGAVSIVSDLGPKIAQLLDFTIELSTRDDRLIVPPPQFIFLPFFQDQDRGWNDGWSSFKNVQMISGYKRSILEYHTGIRPREFYIAKAAKSEAQHAQNDLRAERRALDKATERLRAGRAGIAVTFQPELFADQIKQLLRDLSGLQENYFYIKQKIADLQSRRAVLIEEIEISRASLYELDKDYRFVQEKFDYNIICSTCNTVHDNNFANRFGLISDVDACRDLLSKARQHLGGVESDIARQFHELQFQDERIDRIKNILEATHGETKLNDMLTDESERILDATIDAERSSLERGIVEWLMKENVADGEMSDHSNPKKKKEIISLYFGKLVLFAEELGINFSSSAFSSVAPKLNETGSYGQRAFLAYQYALLHTIQEFTTSVLCPIIIDTVLKEDPDKENIERILAFAINNRPKRMQLILGTVSLHNVKYSGYTINPTIKESFLSASQFEEIDLHLRPFVRQMLSLDQGELF